ncbi:MAG: VIT1/CCC1 transporter family protein [Candidatus Norongarragalinales archaeon]
MEGKTKFDLEKHLEEEHHELGRGGLLRDSILGGQDGLVNVLGIVLGVAAATLETRVVIIAGLAATFAESLAMAAVAYTSTKAERDFYWNQYEKEKAEIEAGSPTEVEEVRELYRRKGFGGKLLETVVKKITSSKKVWLDFMMHEELKLDRPDGNSPSKSAVVVGVSAFIGSLVPLVGFFFLPVKWAMVFALVFSSFVLFAAGVVKAKLTVGSWWKTGLEMTAIGMLAAVSGYAIGAFLGVVV